MTQEEKTLQAARGFNLATYDFGLRKPGEKLDFTFTHTNEGDMFIEAVEPGCGCAEPSKITKKVIKGSFQLPDADTLNKIQAYADKDIIPYQKGMIAYIDDGTDTPIHIIEKGIYKKNPEKITVDLKLKANIVKNLS